MTMQEARPGSVLRDKDGDYWWRGETTAAVLTEGGHAVDAFARSLRDVEEFGPFTLVATVPEERTP